MMIYSLFNIFLTNNDLFFLTSLLLIIFILIPYTLLIFIDIWVYKDAKKRKLNAAVWVLIVWIIPFFAGLILYLIFRKKTESNN